MKLSLEDVSVGFGNGVRALDQVRLEIGPGEAVGLVGPSGAGKTTFLHLLNATVRPTSGQVLIGGEKLTALSGREVRVLRSRIATIHQDLGLVGPRVVPGRGIAGRLGLERRGGEELAEDGTD